MGVYCLHKNCLSFYSERRENGVGKSCCQNYSSSAKIQRLSCFTTTDGTKTPQEQIHFGISLEFTIVAKWNARFIKKKVSQLKSDIRSYQSKNFKLKQASGLIGRVRNPRTLPLCSSTAGIIARDVTMAKIIRRAISIGAIDEFITLLIPPSCFNFALDTDQKVAVTWYEIDQFNSKN